MLCFVPLFPFDDACIHHAIAKDVPIANRLSVKMEEIMILFWAGTVPE
jgi:hypothetical protein